MSDEPDRDLLAAEFVLGSLEGAERGEAERLLAADPSFARSVAAWQQRLTPLAANIAPVTPPVDLWRSIEASIDPPVTASLRPFRRRVRFWQATTAGALAVAASLAAFVLLRQPEQVRVALLAPLSGGAPVLMATTNRGGELVDAASRLDQRADRQGPGTVGTAAGRDKAPLTRCAAAVRAGHSPRRWR